MFFSKVVAVFALVAVCHAGYIGHSSHGSQGHGVSSQSFQLDSSQKSYDHDDHHYDHHSNENAYPRYEFKYSVSDDETNDQKTHQETRDGDNVEGEYSLLQPDGKTRTVTYRADKEHGFQAEVRTTGGNEQYQDFHQYEQLQHQHY